MLYVIITYRRDYTLRKAQAFHLQSEINVPTFQHEIAERYRAETRKNCQIIYVLGVEGATHHGFAPILEYLANNQVDPATGIPYDIVMSSRALKFGVFGWYKAHGMRLGFNAETPPLEDPELVQRVIADICPNDGRKHVIVEDNSFPCGQEDDRRSYRVHRQHDWLRMSPEEIADSESGNNQPTNLNAFYKAYSPYADVKFLVLHRPYLEVIASHAEWDTGPVVHSNIIRGFMIILRRFLDSHMIDPKTGRKLWHLICVEKHFAKFYNFDDVAVAQARKNMLHEVASFLDWPVKECPNCFDSWHESTKDHAATLGPENLQILDEHMKSIEGTWPPNRQCRV
ncbi:hypothetical protein ACHAXN_005675 [Cyclotella atomus]|jgi:hypothetical protein